MNTGSQLIAAAVAAAALVSAVAAAAAVPPPARIAAADRIVFCSDLGYPPMESLQGSRAIGADIDIGSAISKSMRVKAQFRNVGFDGIIAALLAKKCDAILSGMTDTAQRRKQVDFTEYLIVGMSLMVKKGNPHHVNGLPSLSGLRVAVQLGTTERDASDDPPVGYYVKKSRGRFEVAADKIQAAPYGIATRKHDPLAGAARAAIAELYASGTMKSILARWGLSAFELRR